MYELKTKETDESVIEFIESVEPPKKREDAYRLLSQKNVIQIINNQCFHSLYKWMTIEYDSLRMNRIAPL